jgi:hypothetical protein
MNDAAWYPVELALQASKPHAIIMISEEVDKSIVYAVEQFYPGVLV